MTPLSPSIRDAARSLRRRPGYAGVVALVTIGIELVDLWRAHATSFAGLAAFVPRDSAWLPPQGPERVASGRVVGDLFPLLGVRLAPGALVRAIERHHALGWTPNP
jgi:hypothetical protein